MKIAAAGAVINSAWLEAELPTGKSKLPKPIQKGQFRCFSCKKPCAIREGSWHIQDSQQVFLCHACSQKNEVSSRGLERVRRERSLLA